MNITTLIAGNLCSLIGMACDSFSASRKTTRGMLLWQSMGQVVFGLSSLILKGYSGAVQSAVSLLRNGCAIAGIKNRYAEWGLVGLGILVSLYFNNLGIIGLLPVIANTEYSIAVFRFKDNERALKVAFLICIALFSVFNLYIMNYVGVLTNVVVFLSTAAFLIKKN